MTDRVTNQAIDSRNEVVERIIDINAEGEYSPSRQGDAHQLRRLMQAIRNRHGSFAIFFAVCNDLRIQKRLSEDMARTMRDDPFVELDLTGNELSLLDRLLAVPQGPQPLVVYGLESLLPSSEGNWLIRERTLHELQLRREQFRELSRPVVLWMPEYVYTLIGQKAVDFWSWQSGGFFFEATQAPKRSFATARRRRSPLPHTLEYELPRFIGRDKEVGELAEQLRAGTHVAIVGLGGIGKTALAFRVADQVRKDFPDGQLFVSLSDSVGTSQAVVDGLREAIQTLEPVAKIPDEPAQLTALYRNLLSGKRVLILIDDADDASSVRRFLPPKHSSLVVTSRTNLRLPGIVNFQLDLLTPDEARTLLLGFSPTISPEIADEICLACGYLPLAIVLAGNFLASREIDPADYLRQLRTLELTLQNSNNKESSSLTSSLQLSYQGLTPDVARVFRQLSVFSGSFDAQAETVICEDTNNISMNALIDIGVVANTSADRYELHGAVRSFAADKLGTEESENTQRRLSKHYLDVLWNASNLYNSGNAGRGIDLFDLEWNNIQAGQSWASDRVEDRLLGAPLCVDYPNAGAHLLFLRRTPIEIIPWLEVAIRASQILGNRKFEEAHLGNLGNLLLATGDTKKAIEQYRKALELARELQDRKGEMVSLGNLGNAHYSFGDTAAGIQFLEQSLTIAREISDRNGEAEALSNLGDVYLRNGNLARATQLFEEALSLMRESDNVRGEAIQLLELGSVYQTAGETLRAIELYEQSLKIAQEIRDHRLEGAVLNRIGRAYASRSEPQRATQFYERELFLARQLGDKQGEGIALGNLGNAYKDLGEVNRAVGFHEEALSIARHLGNRVSESYALGNLGNLYHMMGHSRRAIELYEQSLRFSQEFGDRSHEAIALGSLGNAYSSLGDYRRSLDFYEQELAIVREIGHRSGEAKTLGNMGIVYEAMGDSNKAIDLYEQGLQIAREIGDHRGEGAVLGNLGGIYARRGDFHRAIDLFQRSLSLAREIGDRHGESHRLGNIANVYAANKEFQSALSSYEEALRLSREIQDRRLEGITLYNISRAFEELRRWSEAKEAAHEASSILESIEDPHAEEVKTFLAHLEKQSQ